MSSPARAPSLLGSTVLAQPHLDTIDSGYSSEPSDAKPVIAPGSTMGKISVKETPAKERGRSANRGRTETPATGKQATPRATPVPDGPRKQKPVLGRPNLKLKLPTPASTPATEPTADAPASRLTTKPPTATKKGRATSLAAEVGPATILTLTAPTAATVNAPTDSFTTEAPATNKASRRTAARKKDADTLFGSEYEAHILEALKGGKANKVDDEEYMPSSPPTLLVAPAGKRNPGQPAEQATPARVVRSDSAEYEIPSSSTISSELAPKHGRGHFPANIDQSIFDLADILRSQTEIQVDLPNLQNDADPDIEEPWTAKHLTHLYIVCYSQSLFHACDLIADTWIRAFQRLNTSKDARHRIWRPNKSVYVDKQAPQWYLDIQDPILALDVTDFDMSLINSLYYYTPKSCGARLLWADAMALCGDKLEDMMERTKEKGKEWHKDAVWDIMCSALRMGRRKLTMKIEEWTEGAWCKRYHVHGKHGLKCYRAMAKDQRDDQVRVERQARKRGAEQMDGEGGQGEAAKRVKFTNRDVRDGQDSEEE